MEHQTAAELTDTIRVHQKDPDAYTVLNLHIYADGPIALFAYRRYHDHTKPSEDTINLRSHDNIMKTWKKLQQAIDQTTAIAKNAGLTHNRRNVEIKLSIETGDLL